MIDLAAIEDRNEWRKKSTDSDRALLAAAVDIDLLLARIEELEEAIRGRPRPAQLRPCHDGQHHWVGRQMGGPPNALGSYEWVKYCDVCGIERTGG
jgi:hypothetical protein